jgi:hypothetical protein
MFLKWSDDLVTGLGSKVSDELVASMTGAFAAYSEFTRDIIERRRTQPTDDLTTVLVHAEVDGQRLSDDEIVKETLLILIGGDEITRRAKAVKMPCEFRRDQPQPDGRVDTAVDVDVLASPTPASAKPSNRDMGVRLSHSRSTEIGSVPSRRYAPTSAEKAVLRRCG